MLSTVVFGAGCIGRGLLGELAARAGWATVFVEAQPGLAHQLNESGSYAVRLVGRGESTTHVTDFRVLTPQDTPTIADELRRCEFAVTAVGGENLVAAADLLASCLPCPTEPLTVLVCENWTRADDVLRQALMQRGVEAGRVRCVPCSVERMVQRLPGSLDLIGESVETAWVAAPVALLGLNVCSDITPYYARKLFTNNAGHALLAYEGFLAGCDTLCAALQEPGIRSELASLLDAAARMLSAEYGLSSEALREHVDALVRYRFANVLLADRVERVARQPLRKLGPQERLVGLLRRLERHALPIGAVCRVIAAALHYDDPRDAESVRLQEMMGRGGPALVLTDVCGMGPDEECFRLCLAASEAIMRSKETQ